MKNDPMREFDCYLFDADGTLFDTTEMIVRCFLNTSRTFHLPEPSRQKIISHVGMPLRRQMESYFGTLSDVTFEQYRKTHMDYQLKIYREHLRLCPGVAEALKCLREKGKQCAVVTSRMLHTLSIYLEETGIDGYFDLLITPESTERHKPDPQPALEAMARLNATPERTLFIGDATFDIECGYGAGTATAFVDWSLNAVDSLRCTPTWIVSDMRDCCIW